MHKINLANIKDWSANYDGELFDGILCDPPYELGFMGKSWDSSGIAFDVEMWQNIYKLLKPGAHLLAFSGSRTYHRMAVAIEDAGFEIRDMIEWVYGSGFPKSLNIGKAVDKIQGNEREFAGYRVEPESGRVMALEPTAHKLKDDSDERYGKDLRTRKEAKSLTKGTSEWEGYGTALKPAHEPCVLARKPIDGTVAQNCLKHGVGGLNIDGSRVGYNEDDAKKNDKGDTAKPHNNAVWKDSNHKERRDVFTPLGRFPANLIHSGEPEVLEVFPDTKSSGGQFKASDYEEKNTATNFTRGDYVGRNDYGSAARFFYTAKASKSERNAGLDGFEVKEVRGGGGRVDQGYDENTQHLKEAARKYGAVKSAKQNIHPTVKPLALTKYLANLIKPPTGGRLLVPFSGSGSEMIGALQAGWEYVEGVELTEEYIPIAEARIKYWLEQMEKEQPSLFNV